MLNLILFGPPGSGKGTQAAYLVKKYGLMHISTGDLFRYEMGNDTPLGLKAKSYISKGDLVPDSITIGMLENKVNANMDAKGFIFDGFPRNVNQAVALDYFLKTKKTKVTALLELDVEDEEIVKRILNRGKTSGRSDDNDEKIIRNRIATYKKDTTPVFFYYDLAKKAKKVNGLGKIEEITKSLCEIIDKKKK